MLYINLSILFIIVMGFVATIKKVRDFKGIDKKEHKLFFLYPLAAMIITKTKLEKVLNRNEKVTNSIKALHVTIKPEISRKIFWCSKLSMVITIIFIFNMLSLLGTLLAINNSKILDGNYLMRPVYGDGEVLVDLEVTMDQRGQEARTDDDNWYSEDISIRVEEQRISDKELRETFEDAFTYINETVLGRNESTEQIRDNLNFFNKIPGTSILVEWRPEDYNLVYSDGTVRNEEIDRDGVRTAVTVLLSYREEQIEYYIPIVIMPKQVKKEELLRRRLEEEIVKASDKTEKDVRLELPQTIEDYQLSWRKKEKNIGTTLFFVGVIAAVFIWVYGDKELDEKMKKRKEQMRMDYPDLISKFTLFVNAGMTVRQAWNKIAEEYEKKVENGQSMKRYAYEEMLVTYHELRLGITERDLYEQYGRRVGILPYMKFTSLISLNLKKGNKGISELLRKEVIEAFEERKDIAKRLGEEAGTKLLAPMMIMLLIIFVVILIPAFVSFGI